MMLLTAMFSSWSVSWKHFASFSVIILSRLQNGWLGNQEPISGSSSDFIFHTARRQALWYLLPRIQWKPLFVTPGMRWPQRITKHSPPFSSYFKIHGVHPHIFYGLVFKQSQNKFNYTLTLQCRLRCTARTFKISNSSIIIIIIIIIIYCNWVFARWQLFLH